MERWAVDLGNPKKSAYALKLTSNLLKELENNEQATIKFTRENAAVLTVNGLSYSLNAVSLNATENYYAMCENREESLLSAVGKVSKKMTTMEQTTTQYVREKSNNVVGQPNQTQTMILPNSSKNNINRGKVQGNNSLNSKEGSQPQKKKTRFLVVGNDAENAQETDEISIGQRGRLPFMGGMYKQVEKLTKIDSNNNSQDNISSYNNSQDNLTETPEIGTKKRPFEDEEELPESVKRVKPNVLQKVEAILAESKSTSLHEENPQNGKRQIKLKVGGSTNNENDFLNTVENTILKANQNNNNSNRNNNQAKVPTKIKLKSPRLMKMI
jgi:hypothetical protein